MSKFSHVLSDADIRRHARDTGVPRNIVRHIERRVRTCDFCGPVEHEDWLSQTNQSDNDPDDWVKRHNGQHWVWVHRDCAIAWEDFNSMSLAQLQEAHDWLQQQLIALEGN